MGFTNCQIIFQLFLSIILGGLIGLEREYRRKEAGLRTFSLVCLGSTLFTLILRLGFEDLIGRPGIAFDPSRIIQAVAMGIGFIGAGLIIYREFHIEGLTTAAGLWVVAAVGVAIGLRFYFPAIFTTFLTVLIFTGFRFFEEKILGSKSFEK